MANEKRLKSSSEKIARSRIKIIILAFFIFSIIVVARLAYIQIYNASYYQEGALAQWRRNFVITPRRGSIIDSKGIVLAQSGDASTVVVEPQKIKASMREEVAVKLSEALNLDSKDILRRISSDAQQVNIKRQLSDDEVEKVIQLRLVGVTFLTEKRRNYPLNDLASQLVGFTDMDGNGQAGIEGDYNKSLTGTQGKIVSEKDASGKAIPYGIEQIVPATHGADCILTLDVAIQATLDQSLDDAIEINKAKNAQGIVMNVKTGEVLAMSTRPSIDLNKLDRKNMDKMREFMNNRVVSDSFMPGESFGIIALSTALEKGIASLETHYDCLGYIEIEGENIQMGAAHGDETLEQAIINGCPSVMAQVVLDMGIDQYYHALENFGFGKATEVGLSGESKGEVIDNKYITLFDLAQMGFGQSIAVTPMQYATAISAIVNNGQGMKPYLVSKLKTPGEKGELVEEFKPQSQNTVLSQRASKQILQVYEKAVSTGNGQSAYIPGYRIGGGPGIAPKNIKDHSSTGTEYIVSYMSFAPIEDPQFVVIIVIDSPTVTSFSFMRELAAPYAREIMHNILKQKHILANYKGDESGILVDVVMPNLMGLTLEEAKRNLEGINMRLQANGTGVVVNQTPSAGVKIPEKTSVLLYMSEPEDTQTKEDNKVTVPNLEGLNLAAAYKKLAKWGLEAKILGDPMGSVAMQSPPAGEKVEPGSVITLTLNVNTNQ